jgi:protein-arginine kinase activator protein McsA
MICPRCDSNTAELMVRSPVGQVWEVYVCTTCFFSWRSTEDESIRDPSKYDKRFKLKPEHIASLPHIPPVPELTNTSSEQSQLDDHHVPPRL